MRGIGMRKLSIWLNIKNGDFLPFVLLLYIMHRSREHNAGTLKRKFTRVFWNTTSQCAYFLYFSPSNLQTTLRIRLRPSPPHTATFRSIHIPPHPRVSWNATPFHFPPGKIIHFQLFPVSLLTNHLPVYIIYEHTFYFFSDRCRVPAPKRGVCLSRIGLHLAKIQRVS